MKIATRYYIRIYNKNDVKPAKYKIAFMSFGHTKDTPLGYYHSVILFYKPQDLYRKMAGTLTNLTTHISRDMVRQSLVLL